MVSRYIDLTGQKFGRLTAIAPAGTTAGRQMKWLCRCECGGFTKPTAAALRDGNSSSCGCLRREKFHSRRHCLTKTPEYRVWASMSARCSNPNHIGFKDYGGRGIVVCEEWGEFENFIRDMGKRPSQWHSIDRIDNNLGYSKGNCRWADRNQQSRNRSNNVMITAYGKTLCLQDWCVLTGSKFNTVRSRIRDLGWAPEKALSTPPLTTNKKKTPIEAEKPTPAEQLSLLGDVEVA